MGIFSRLTGRAAEPASADVEGLIEQRTAELADAETRLVALDLQLGDVAGFDSSAELAQARRAREEVAAEIDLAKAQIDRLGVEKGDAETRERRAELTERRKKFAAYAKGYKAKRRAHAEARAALDEAHESIIRAEAEYESFNAELEAEGLEALPGLVDIAGEPTLRDLRIAEVWARRAEIQAQRAAVDNAAWAARRTAGG